jgi:hypothetical protein
MANWLYREDFCFQDIAMAQRKLSFFDSLKAALFGSGVIRFEATTTDGREITVKYPFIGALEAADMPEIKRDVHAQFLTKYGRHLKSIRYISHYVH